MKNKNTFLLFYSVLLLLILNCTTYTHNLINYQVPVSFGNEEKKGEKARSFRIEKKLTWFLFDTIKTQELDLGRTFEEELPNAKRIYILRIQSEEGPLDSIIRLVSTGFQVWAFVSNRPLLFSRRTVVITGDVIE